MSINSIFKPNDYDVYLKNVHGDEIKLLDIPSKAYADPSYTETILINPATKEIARATKAAPAPAVQNIALIGNPVHQFVSGGSGDLDFRGMISPDDSITFNVTPTNIEMVASIPPYDIQVTRVVYVAQDADLAVANGSPYYPYQTIQQAIDIIKDFGDATSAEPYLVNCAPGTYVEGNLILYPFISIGSQGCDIIGSQLTFVSLDISNLDQPGGTNFIFSKMTINSVINIDTSSFNDGLVMIFLECNIQSDINYIGDSQSVFVVKSGSWNGSDMNVAGGQIFVDSNFTAFASGTITLDTGIAGVNLLAEVTGNEFSGRNVVVSSTNVGQTVTLLWDSAAASFNSTDDASITLQIGSLPITNNINSLLATVVARTTDSIASGFNTTVPSLWSTLPNNVATALDVLASSQWRVINDAGTAFLGFFSSGASTTMTTSGISDMNLIGSGVSIFRGGTSASLQSVGGSVGVSAGTTINVTAGSTYTENATIITENANAISMIASSSVSISGPTIVSAATTLNRISASTNTGIIRLGGSLDNSSIQMNYGGPFTLAPPGPATATIISNTLLAAVALQGSYKGRVSIQMVGTTITNIYSSYIDYVISSDGVTYNVDLQNETSMYTSTAPAVTVTLIINGTIILAAQVNHNGFAETLQLRYNNTFTRIA